MKTFNQTLRTPFIFLLSIAYTLFISCSSDDDTSAPLSSKKEVTQFTLTEGTTVAINQDDNTITATVPFGTDVTSITPALSISENATYAPTGVQDFSSPVVYTITAQDESEVQYTVTVVSANNTEAALLSFIFKTEDNSLEEDIEATIDQENHTVTAEVPFGTEMTALTATITTSEGATTNLDELDFSSEVTLTVTAQDGEITSDYTVNITEDVNTEASLLSFIFKAEDNSFEGDIEATINQEALTVTTLVPFGTDLSALVANITTSEVATTNLDELDFSSEVILTVTAQDGETTTDYTVSITESIDPKITERAALIAIYNADDNYLSWPVDDESSDIADWEGVVVNEQGLVIELNMVHKAVSILSERITDLKALKTLNLNNNESLASLPENIGDLSQLEALLLSGNKITHLPESIGNLTALKTLFLSNNQLQNLPDSFGNLMALETLSLSNNDLQTLPENFENLISLEILNLYNNNLQSLPESFGKLSNLKELSIANNDLGYLPDSFGDLISLQVLYVDRNELQGLPGNFGNLTGLTHLELSFNSIIALPESFKNLNQLKELNLKYNELENLPESFGNLTALTILDLENNALQSLPENFGDLVNLTELILTSNSLVSLPENFGNLTGLKELNLGYNDLESLPERIGDLTGLTDIFLYGSQLQNLPESIVNLTKLTGLWVHNNNLQTLPENIVNLSQLNQFRLSGNPDLILTTQQCDFVTTISSYTLDDDICE